MWCKWGLHLTQFVTDFGVCRYLSMSEWIWLSQYNYWASNRMFILLSWESFLPAKFPMGKTIEYVEMCCCDKHVLECLFHTHVWIQGIIPLSTTTTNFFRYYLKNIIAYWIWTKSKAYLTYPPYVGIPHKGYQFIVYASVSFTCECKL